MTIRELSVTIPKELPVNMNPVMIERHYSLFMLPLFGIVDDIHWQQHIKTGPDNFLHCFISMGERYVLAYDDYPSGFSNLVKNESVEILRTKEGATVVRVHSGERGNFILNVTGSFMLFRVNNEQGFEEHARREMAEYNAWQNEQVEKDGKIAVARDILQLAETAALNEDYPSLGALNNLICVLRNAGFRDEAVDIDLLSEYVCMLPEDDSHYSLYSREQVEETRDKIYRSLARSIQNTINARRHEEKYLGEMTTLVSAMYAQKEKDVTRGISAIVLVKDKTFEYPLEDHRLNKLLARHFAENSRISESNIKYNMPKHIDGYDLVAGTVEVRRVFRRELDYITF